MRQHVSPTRPSKTRSFASIRSHVHYRRARSNRDKSPVIPGRGVQRSVAIGRGAGNPGRTRRTHVEIAELSRAHRERRRSRSEQTRVQIGGRGCVEDWGLGTGDRQSPLTRAERPVTIALEKEYGARNERREEGVETPAKDGGVGIWGRRERTESLCEREEERPRVDSNREWPTLVLLGAGPVSSDRKLDLHLDLSYSSSCKLNFRLLASSLRRSQDLGQRLRILAKNRFHFYINYTTCNAAATKYNTETTEIGIQLDTIIFISMKRTTTTITLTSSN